MSVTEHNRDPRMRKVRIFVQSAKGLERGLIHSPTPFALVSVNGNRVLTTQAIKDNCNPYWNESCDIDMSPDAVVEVEVRDERKQSKKHPEQGSLGTVEFRLGDVLDLAEESSHQFVKRTLSPLYGNHHVRGTITVVLHTSRSGFTSTHTTPVMSGLSIEPAGLPLPSTSNRSYINLPAGSSSAHVTGLQLNTSGESPSRPDTNYSPVNYSPTSSGSHVSLTDGNNPYSYSAGSGVGRPIDIPASSRARSTSDVPASFEDTYFGTMSGTTTGSAPRVRITAPSTLDLHDPPPYSEYAPPSWSASAGASTSVQATHAALPHSRSTGDLNTHVARPPPLSMSRAQMPGTDVDAALPHMSAPGIQAGARLAVLDFRGQALAEVEVLSNDVYAHGATAQILRGKMHDAQGTVVALKVFKAMLSREDQQMLRRELIACSQLNNERILHFIGTTSIGYHTILVSVFMKNGNLDNYLQAHPQADRTRLVYQVADAVAFLHHQANRVHGDLKCQNVLVNDAGDAVLADFGLSTTIDKPEGEATTLTGIMQLHTLQFAAPEILMGSEENLVPFSRANRPRSKTQQSDVYAFGSLLLQAFIGEPPWKGVNQIGIITSVTTGRIPPRPTPAVAERTGFTEMHWQICLQCWTFHPRARPTMLRVRDDLAALRYRR